MRVVLDTNVVVSALFFGGTPQRVVGAVCDGILNAYATQSILAEYERIIGEMMDKKHYFVRRETIAPILEHFQAIPSESNVHICRDPDDDKFLSCAVDCKAIYVVSGDKDLLSIGEYEGIEIITAKELLERMGN